MNFNVCTSKKQFFFVISQKQGLIEQNGCHFLIQRARITLENCRLPRRKMTVVH